MRHLSVHSIYALLIIFITVISYAQENVYKKDGILYNNYIQHEDFNKNIHSSKPVNKPSHNKSILPVLKEDFMVNTLDGEYGSNQTRIKSAMDGYGNRAYVWQDYRNAIKEIYAQFYDANGNKAGNNFKVNNFELFGNNSPFISANSQGDFVITYLIDFSSVVAQRYNSSGQLINGSIFVNTTSGWNTMEPCVAVNDDGSYMVMWASEPGQGGYTVYARLLDNLGNFIGSEIVVSEPDKKLSSIGQSKQIAVDQNGNYCLTWSSYAGGSNSQIYLQLINKYGAKINGNMLVSNPTDIRLNYFPTIASVNDGTFMILWGIEDNWPEPDESGSRIYNIQNGFVNDVTILSDSMGGYGLFPISSDRNNTFYCLCGGYDYKRLTKVNKYGDIISNTRLNDLPDFNYSYYTNITDVINNQFYFSFEAYKKGDTDLYDKGYDSALIPITALGKINDDSLSSIQKNPLVAFNKFGESIVLWEDTRNGWEKLFAQLYDNNFNPINSNIQIDDTHSDQWFLHNKIVKSQSDGTFVIAFTGSESYYDSDIIYLQAIDRNGNKKGGNIIAKELSYNIQYQLAMSIDSTDEMLLAYYDRYGARIRVYNKDLALISQEKILLQTGNSFGYNPIAITIDDNLNIFGAWQSYNFQNYQSGNEIYGQFFKKDGSKASAVKVIDSTNNNILMMQCANDGLEDFILIYKDETGFYFNRNYMIDKQYQFKDHYAFYSYDKTNINIVRFKNKKAFVTFNCYADVRGYYLNDSKRTPSDYELYTYPYINYSYEVYNGVNSAAINEGRLFFAYESNRNGNSGSDIWANVQKADNLNFKSDWFYKKVDSDLLYNNFPNPFNSTTKIAYEILAFHHVKLAVYDILGREIKVLKNENQEKGIYELEFNAAGLASGVYFLKLEAFNTIIKKMIVLK